MKFELSEIGEIHCTLNFNEDWYNDYLQENGLTNSQETLQDYVREECDYDIEYYDSETYHSMNEYDTMTIDEMPSHSHNLPGVRKWTENGTSDFPTTGLANIFCQLRGRMHSIGTAKKSFCINTSLIKGDFIVYERTL